MTTPTPHSSRSLNRNSPRPPDETLGRKTHSSPEKPKVIEVGGRKVSWEDLLVSLKKDTGRPGIGSAMQSTRNISLGDVIASEPVHEEAERHIVRAVEKLAANTPETQEKDEETERLFNDIISGELKQTPNQVDNEIAAPIPPNGEVSSNGPEGAPSQRSELSSNAANRPKARFKKLVNKHIVSKNVEQTLFGLSSALSHMNEGRETGVSGTTAQSPSDRMAEGVFKRPSTDLEAQVPEGTENEKTQHESESSFSEYEGSDQSQTSKGRHHNGFFQDKVVDGIEENWSLFHHFLAPRKAKAKSYAKKVVMFIMIPSLVISAFLFYMVENPSLCEEEPLDAEEEFFVELEPQVEPVFDANGTVIGNVTVVPEEPEREFFVCPGLGASVSWWLLFLGVRQIVTLTLALITQSFIVDFLALSTRFCLAWFGPVVTLLLVQAKGWPFIAVFWALYDLILLSGDREYAHHWGFWQDWISLFNQNNPSGNVVDHEWNYKVLRLTIFIGVAVALKRLCVSLFLGRQTFARYGEQLAELMKNMVLLGEVATLAKDIERFSGDYANNAPSLPMPSAQNTIQNWWTDQAESVGGSDEKTPQVNAAEAANVFVTNRNAPATDGLINPAVLSQGVTSVMSASEDEFSRSQRIQLSELLEAWEEPQTAEQKEQKHISIGAVLQFRQALAFMKVRYPFLPAFGPADTRQHCLESAQEVFARLLLRTPNETVLPFDTLALLAKDDDGKIDAERAKVLIKAFRPDRDGKLTQLDFLKSCDAIYKSIRLLSANITNSSQIDSAVEGIINVVFYAIIASIALAWLGVNPLQLFLSLSSFLLVFAFAFGSSSAKYFEGMLFILIQSPYGVGDRIHLSSPNQDTSIDGSSGWIVEQVSLYTTSLYWGATNERATLANGAISNMRVINAARSPNAQVFVNMKFSIDTPYEKIEVFKAAVEQFLKDRPREWLAFVGFRPTEVAVEKGYINYVTIAQHRSAWQDIGSVLVSKAELVTYELEVAKKLEMRYHSPHLPVDLQISGQSGEFSPQDIHEMAGSIQSQSYRPRMTGESRAFLAGGGDE